MKKAFFSIADINNIKYFEKLKNSFKKFHPNEELILFGEEEIRIANDQWFFYRATPYCARKLMNEGYDWLCKLDADTIITGNLDHIWEDEYDVAVVQNANPREMKIYPVGVLDINPMEYVNCGFVVMKNRSFVDHWWRLCKSKHFEPYQFKEQDLLNIMVYYGNYRVKFLDKSNKWHGLISKG